MGNLTVVSTIFWPSIVSNLSVVSIRFQMENLTVVLTIFWHFLLGNLSVVSILFSSAKSNRCFNNFFAFHCRQFIGRFNSFLKWKISPLFQQFFLLFLLGNVSVVSILFSNNKSHGCLNNLLAFDYRQYIRCFNSFIKCEISPLFQRCFGFFCRYSIHRFNSFLK